jgi:glutaredoxin
MEVPMPSDNEMINLIKGAAQEDQFNKMSVEEMQSILYYGSNLAQDRPSDGELIKAIDQFRIEIEKRKNNLSLTTEPSQDLIEGNRAGAIMAKIFILIIIISCGFYFWKHHNSEPQKLSPLYEGSYIVVYGRDACGWTTKYRRDLENLNIDYVYKSVDDASAANELEQRMEKAGLDISHYNLPVIDVNANILIRPEMKIILDIYKKGK